MVLLENACVVCIRMLLSASICLSTLQKHEGSFVLISKSAWGVLSTLYYWAWGVLSAFKKKNMWWFLSTYNKMDVGGYVRGVFCPYTGNFGFRKKRNCAILVAKTKVLISFAVTAKLICAVIFANAK